MDMEHTSPSQVALGKRKAEDAREPDPPRTGRPSRAHSPLVERKAQEMITISAFCATVAQKSYGAEKRYICPPPSVSVQGGLPALRTQRLIMSVVDPDGKRTAENRVESFDQGHHVRFKTLHVGDVAKHKTFKLVVSLCDPIPGEEQPEHVHGRSWADFESAAIPIISKPPKKAANYNLCIVADGPVSLFNRINSQTARTSYMILDDNTLSVHSDTWSAFNVNVLTPACDTSVDMNAPRPVLYGSSITLSEVQTGITSQPFILRQVVKGRVSLEDNGVVGQMQKVCLLRVNADGSRHYLSAPDSSSLSRPSSPLSFRAATVKETMDSKGVREEFDEINDRLCWTICGVSKFQYTFFHAGGSDAIPQKPITPFPTLLTTPVYHPRENTLDLTLNNFIHLDLDTDTDEQLEVFLGNLGPLPQESLSVFGIQSKIVVTMPSLPVVIQSLQDDALPIPNSQSTSIHGRSLPLLFIRASDNVGYHSGRTIECVNLFRPTVPEEVDEWMVERQAAALHEGALGGWTLRVL